MKNIIEMKHINKHFKNQQVLNRITFSVQEGEIFGFLGPSGAGKTTTIKILTGQLLASSGEVKLFNKNLPSLKKDIFKHIGILSDMSGVYDRLTVGENLTIFADIYHVDRQEIDELLDRVDLLKDKNKVVKKLSRGMKQRLMIARTLIHKPRLLFLDEPTSALDPGTANEIHKLLLELNQEGTTIFLTTHRMDEADKLCNRVAFLNDGEIVRIGNPEELKLEYAEDCIEVTLKSNKRFCVTKDLEGIDEIKRMMAKDDILAIHSKEPNLEEIFLSITGRGL